MGKVSHRARLLAACSVFGALGACTFFADFDDLTKGAPDAGSTDAARLDAVSPPGEDARTGEGIWEPPLAAPCPKDAFVCDDFEGQPFALWNDVRQVAQGTVKITSNPSPTSRFGLNAARIRVEPIAAGLDAAAVPTASKSVLEKDTGPVRTPQLALRAFVFMSTLVRDTGIMKVLHIDNGAVPEDTTLKLSDNGTLDANTDNAVANDSSTYSADPVPVGRWFCLEWVVTIGTAGHHSVYIDDVAVIDADENTVGTMVAPYDRVQVGFTAPSSDTPRELFVDDVAIAPTRIGCR